MLLHSNPYLGKVYMFELDPSDLTELDHQLSFTPGALIRL